MINGARTALPAPATILTRIFGRVSQMGYIEWLSGCSVHRRELMRCYRSHMLLMLLIGPIEKTSEFLRINDSQG